MACRPGGTRGEPPSERGGGVEAINADFLAIKGILSRVLTVEEYNRFFASLTGVGVTVSLAAGDPENPASDEEAAALLGLLTEFDVDLQAGRGSLNQL